MLTNDDKGKLMKLTARTDHSLAISKSFPLHDLLPMYGDPIVLVEGMYCPNTQLIAAPFDGWTLRECGDEIWKQATCSGGNG